MFILFSDNETRSPPCQSIASWEPITVRPPRGHWTLVQWWLWDTRACDTRDTWRRDVVTRDTRRHVWVQRHLPGAGQLQVRGPGRAAPAGEVHRDLPRGEQLHTYRYLGGPLYTSLVDKAWWGWGLPRQQSIKLLVSRKFNENCKISRFLPFFENTFLLYKESPTETESHLPILPSL